MLEKLEQLIEEEKWEEARKLELEMEAYQEPSDRFSILNTMIYMQEGDFEAALKCITVGLLLNPGNYELYYLLGNYYLPINRNQAFLCYEQARAYCDDKENQQVLEESMAFLREMEDFQTAPFVICRYDMSDDLFLNVLRILQTADADSDLLIIRSDSVVPANAIFWLRMGLYEKESVGAVGPLSNTSMNEQSLAVSFQSMEEYLQVAGSLQIPSGYAYENKVYLEDSAVLIKRKALNQVLELPEVNSVFRVVVPFVGMKTDIIEYDRDKRFAGKTKYNLKSMIPYALDSITGISVEPLRKLMYFIPLMAIAFIASLRGLILGAAAWKPACLVIMVLSVMFGFGFIAIAVVAEYVAQIMIEVKGRPISIIYNYTACENVKGRQ